MRVESSTDLNATRAHVFPCNTAMLRNGPLSAALAVNSLGTAIELPHQALLTLPALLPTHSDQSSWKGICNYCSNQIQEERRVILKAFYMKTVSFPVQEARDRARLWLFMCLEWDWECEGAPRSWVTSSRWQQWATAAGYAPFSSRCTQAPEVSALPVTNRFTRPSVWAQTAHSLPSFAAQIFTTHRQYRVCYGLANEQLFKPIDSPSSPVLIIWILHEWEYCLFF